MVSEFGVRAVVEPEVDRAAARDAQSDLESQLGEASVGVGATGVGGLGGGAGLGGGGGGAVSSGLSGLGAGAAARGAAGAAGGGGLGSLAGSTAASAALPMALVGGGVALGIKAGIDTLAKASPALQGTFQIMDTAMTLFFRPFGRFLSTILRPAAVGLLSFSTRFNEIASDRGLRVALGFVDESVKDFLGFGGAEDILEEATGLEIDMNAVEWATILNPVSWPKLIGEIIWDNFIDKIDWGDWINKLKKWVGNVITAFPEWIGGVIDNFPGWIGNVIDNFPGWIGEAIDNFPDWVGENGIISNFPGWPEIEPPEWAGGGDDGGGGNGATGGLIDSIVSWFAGLLGTGSVSVGGRLMDAIVDWVGDAGISKSDVLSHFFPKNGGSNSIGVAQTVLDWLPEPSFDFDFSEAGININVSDALTGTDIASQLTGTDIADALSGTNIGKALSGTNISKVIKNNITGVDLGSFVSGKNLFALNRGLGNAAEDLGSFRDVLKDFFEVPGSQTEDVLNDFKDALSGIDGDITDFGNDLDDLGTDISDVGTAVDGFFDDIGGDDRDGVEGQSVNSTGARDGRVGGESVTPLSGADADANAPPGRGGSGDRVVTLLERIDRQLARLAAADPALNVDGADLSRAVLESRERDVTAWETNG